mmetsp:Transcript_25870/g.56714  ORF Transcript_25870/g.56714 Transcript_25870/m.56714 type:complete len:215 (-) Transcript_25870:757-1401(-)
MKFEGTGFDNAARRGLFLFPLLATDILVVVAFGCCSCFPGFFLVFLSQLGAIDSKFVPVCRLSRFDAHGLVFQGSRLDRPLHVLFSDEVFPHSLSQQGRTRSGSEKDKRVPNTGYRWNFRRRQHQNLHIAVVVVVARFPNDAFRALGKDHFVAVQRQVRLFVSHCLLDVFVLRGGQRKGKRTIVAFVVVAVATTTKIGKGNLVHWKHKGIQPLQ